MYLRGKYKDGLSREDVRLGTCKGARGSWISRRLSPRPSDFKNPPAEAILEWAVGGRLLSRPCVACSMQDAVVVDLAIKIEPRIDVFRETQGGTFRFRLIAGRYRGSSWPTPTLA